LEAPPDLTFDLTASRPAWVATGEAIGELEFDADGLMIQSSTAWSGRAEPVQPGPKAEESRIPP